MCAECESFFSEDDAFALGQIWYNHTFDLSEDDFLFIPESVDLPKITPPLLPSMDDKIRDRIISGELEEPMLMWRQSVFTPVLPTLFRNHMHLARYPVVPYDPKLANLVKNPFRYLFRRFMRKL